MFENIGELIFLGVRQGVAKKSGNVYKMLQVADPENFENYEFWLSDEVNLPSLNLREPIKIKLGLQKRDNNVSPVLVGVSKCQNNNQKQEQK